KRRISVLTSAAGRFQLSLENANSVSAPMPRLGAASTVRRTASAPTRWPAVRSRPRRCAQRPLPSRMIATCRGLCDIKFYLKKNGRLPAWGGSALPCGRVPPHRRRTPGGGEAVLGLRNTAVERLRAADVVGLLELARVDAEISVRHLQ